MSERKGDDDFTMTLASYIDSLISASKQGNMTSALLWLGQINALGVTATTGNNAKDTTSKDVLKPLNLLSVEYIFRPQPNSRKDSKSALFHAALNGHYHLVEYYLSLYLVYAISITMDSIKTKQSFRRWFIQLNCSGGRKKSYKKKHKENKKSKSFFGVADYDQCVISSTEEDVMNVMVKKKVDISYAMKVVDQASFSCVPYSSLIEPRMEQIYHEVKNVTEKKKKKMMMGKRLNCDDIYYDEIGPYTIEDGLHGYNNSVEDSDIFTDDDFDKNDKSNDCADSKSFCSLVEKEYTIIENPDWCSVLSIQYVDIEDDILAVEVELRDKTRQHDISIDVQSCSQKAFVTDRGSTLGDDENTLNSRETFATRASWLPNKITAHRSPYCREINNENSCLKVQQEEDRTKQVLKLNTEKKHGHGNSVRLRRRVGLRSSSSRHNARGSSHGNRTTRSKHIK